MSSQLLKTMSESRPMFGATLLSQTTEEHPIPALITMCVKEIEKKGKAIWMSIQLLQIPSRFHTLCLTGSPFSHE